MADRDASSSASVTPTDGDGGRGSAPQGHGDQGGPATAAAAPTFRQIPINALMDHNDDVRRVCEDFTRALKVHAAEEERLSGGIYRALQATGNGRIASPTDQASPMPPPLPPPPPAAPTAPPGSEGEMPSIDAALLCFRGFLSSLAQAHARYARCLTDEVRRPLQALLEQQHQQHARIKLDWNRVVKGFYAQREALGRAKHVVMKAMQDHEAACALYETAAERRSVSMASFTSDLHKVRQRCERAQLQRAQAEQLEREARGDLYDAVAERDDFVRHAARAYQEMEGKRLRELQQAMLAAARAERAHCQARLREADALERAAAAVDVEGDIQRMVTSHRDPEATHSYARALVILDWAWRRQLQQEQQERERAQRQAAEEEARRREAAAKERGESRQPPPLPASGGSSTELELAESSSSGGHGKGSSAIAAAAGAEATAAAAVAVDGNGEEEGEGEKGVLSGIDAVLERLLRLPPPSLSPASAPNKAEAPFAELVESEQGRAYFLQRLNDRRGAGDVGAGYGGLARCFQLLLDKCQAAHDVRGAQQALAMANTFFRAPSSGEEFESAEGEGREYLLLVVKAHPIWRERRVWEDSLMLSVADQLALCPQTRPWEELSGEALREQVVRVHNLIFAQLASLALHMRECGVPVEEAKGFVRTMAGRTQLGEEQAAALEGEMARWGVKG